MMLAQIQNVEPQFLHQSTMLLLIGISALTSVLGSIVAGVTAVRTGRVQRREVVEGESWAPKRETAAALARLEADLTRVANERRTDTAALYNEIRGIRENVAALDVSTTTTNQRLAVIESDIKQLLKHSAD